MGAGPRGWFVAAVLGGCAAGALCAAALERRGAAVELQVLELVRVHGGQLVLVLGEKQGARKLPVPVSKAEAEMIDHARSSPRGLLAASLDALGGTVLGACLDEMARDRSLRGHLSLARGSRQLQLEASAGEVLALALQAGAPIAADPDLLDEAGVSPDDLVGQRARNLRRGVEDAPVERL